MRVVVWAVVMLMVVLAGIWLVSYTNHAVNSETWWKESAIASELIVVTALFAGALFRLIMVADPSVVWSSNRKEE